MPDFPKSYDKMIEDAVEARSIKKPNIEEVFAAFQEYQNDQRKAMNGNASSWASKFNKLQSDFKNKLEKLGLAEHIDWNNPNGE